MNPGWQKWGALVVAAALMLGGCDRAQEGAVRVTVIGEAPSATLKDPASGTLTVPEGVLLQNAGQGLVRFDAEGNIVGGLAERWNVSDDGLSYIFRLETGEWPSGRRISAQDVARILRRQIADASKNSLKDTAGAVTQVVAMTDRVLAIELSAPRAHLLQLLAQPEFGIVRNGQGSGPFQPETRPNESLRLVRELAAPEGEEPEVEQVELSAAPAEQAIQAFTRGQTDLVLGGTFADLGLVIGARTPRGALRFDPVAGLFGLVPARRTGIAADAELRALLDRAIDRDALVGALGVPDLEARATILQPGLDSPVVPVAPEWASVPIAERRTALAAEARRLLAPDEPADEGEEPDVPTVRIALPAGPGAAILLARLRADWEPLGLRVEEAGEGRSADFRLVDRVAPSVSPAWFLRAFRCGAAPVCSEEADDVLDRARQARVGQDRYALFAEAERIMRAETLFLPLAAPVRWSLVRSGLPGFVENRFGHHILTSLRQPPE